MERALEGIGVGWVKTVDNFRVGAVAKTLKEAMNTEYKGLKVIVAEGECQLERQRKLRPVVSAKLSSGERHVRVKYGVDEDTCTGDHSCIRLSGCPTLTVKDNPDPLRHDPVATVIDGCVGCGVCGENAHAAVLCPSFYEARVVQNANFFDRLLFKIRSALSGTPVH
jgi:indolepyruvate ferredoxin oxidoreductase alpha subunit